MNGCVHLPSSIALFLSGPVMPASPLKESSAAPFTVASSIESITLCAAASTPSSGTRSHGLAPALSTVRSTVSEATPRRMFPIFGTFVKSMEPSAPVIAAVA